MGVGEVGSDEGERDASAELSSVGVSDTVGVATLASLLLDDVSGGVDDGFADVLFLLPHPAKRESERSNSSRMAIAFFILASNSIDNVKNILTQITLFVNVSKRVLEKKYRFAFGKCKENIENIVKMWYTV